MPSFTQFPVHAMQNIVTTGVTSLRPLLEPPSLYLTRANRAVEVLLEALPDALSCLTVHNALHKITTSQNDPCLPCLMRAVRADQFGIAFCAAWCCQGPLTAHA